jgi:hypothetical protein
MSLVCCCILSKQQLFNPFQSILQDNLFFAVQLRPSIPSLHHTVPAAVRFTLQQAQLLQLIALYRWMQAVPLLLRHFILMHM